MSAVGEYIISNWFEFVAAALGIIAIFLQIRVNAFYWIVSVLNVLMYIWVYSSQSLYALMLLMVYYAGMSVYGWYKWHFGDRHGNQLHRLRITHTNIRTWIYIAIAIEILFLLITWILFSFTDSSTALLDGLVTALSFVATWMLARKKLENWIIWFITNVISCYLYYTQNMFPTLFLYVILSVMAIVGYFAWKRKMKDIHA